MSDTSAVHDHDEHPMTAVPGHSEQGDLANRAADMATDRYVAAERARRRASLNDLLRRYTSQASGTAGGRV